MPATAKHDDYPMLFFIDAAAFEKWLHKNHAKSNGIWLKIARAQSGIRSLDYAGALDVCLCYGWIDGTRKSLDEEYFVQKFTPRRAGSIWSEINRKKVQRLIDEGRMQPAGLAAIEEAKKNGRWDKAYESPKAIKVPAELQKALDASPKAKRFFATLSSQNRFAILFRIANVKKEETKQRKIKEFVAMLEKGQTIYPQKSNKEV
jgi:uncharacterized protein YdeI (YjbR/CyaY-like superfamily)